MKHARDDYDRIQDPAGIIPDDEPVFLLRAQDCAAPASVRCWAEVNDELGGDPAMSKLARDHADLMSAWPIKKLADVELADTTDSQAAPTLPAGHPAAPFADEVDVIRGAYNVLSQLEPSARSRVFRYLQQRFSVE